MPFLKAGDLIFFNLNKPLMMTNDKLLVYLYIAAFVWVFFKLVTFFIYIRLKKKLTGTDLETFTRQLGDDYAFRFLEDNKRRYKWKKGLLIIKASFDEQDRLASRHAAGFSFFTPFIMVVFS
ncbi:MAG: hypothetical protein QM791_13900 [Ferruginibacter sp.]